MKKLSKLKLNASVLSNPQMKVVTGGSGVGAVGCPISTSGNSNDCHNNCHPGGVLTESGVCYMWPGSSRCECVNYRDL